MRKPKGSRRRGVADRRGGLRGLRERHRAHGSPRRGAGIDGPDFGVLEPHRQRPEGPVVQAAWPAQEDPEQIDADLAPLDPPVGALGNRDAHRPQGARPDELRAEGDPLAESLPSPLTADDRDPASAVHQCGDFEIRVAVPQQLRHDLPVRTDLEVESALHRQAARFVSLQESEAQPRRGAAVGELVRTAPRELAGGSMVGARLRRPVEERAGRHRGGVGQHPPLGRPHALFVPAKLDHRVTLVDIPPGGVHGAGHIADHELRRPQARLPARQTDAAHRRPPGVRTAGFHVVQPQPHLVLVQPIHAEDGRPQTASVRVQDFQPDALGGAAR